MAVSESLIFKRFSGGACPSGLPYIIRAFGAESLLVSPVTLVLNVQLQTKTPYQVKTIPSDMIPIRNDTYIG